MNLVDILIWIALLTFAVKGFMKGLVMEVCSLAGVVVGGWAAIVYCHPLAEVLRQHSKLPSALTSILSFGLIFLSLGLLFFFLGHLLTTLFKIVLLGGLNRIGGVLMGLVQGALVVSVLLSFAGSKQVPMTVSSHLASSATARPFLACGKKILSWWKADSEPGNPRKPVRAPSTTAEVPGHGTYGFRERL